MPFLFKVSLNIGKSGSFLIRCKLALFLELFCQTAHCGKRSGLLDKQDVNNDHEKQAEPEKKHQIAAANKELNTSISGTLDTMDDKITKILIANKNPDQQ